MSSRGEVARAIACFESSEDIAWLHGLTREVAEQVRNQVKKLLAAGDEDALPVPADLYPAREAATPVEAARILRGTTDFALLQALARAIGRRIEAVEIVASADLPAGTRVSVPERPGYPASARRVIGTVDSTGTMLDVRLDSGERWQGPPSLAARASEPEGDPSG